MKNSINTLLIKIVFLVAFLTSIVNAQSERTVIVEPFIEDELAQAIIRDTTGRREALPMPTVYILKRGGVYPLVTGIQNVGYNLNLRAEDGSGSKPMVVMSPQPGGTYSSYTLRARTDTKLENIVFDMAQPTGGFQTRSIGVYDGATLEVIGCVIKHDRAAALTVASDSCSLIVRDCIIHSMGANKAFGDNGRPFEIRAANYFRKVEVINTTIFNICDRLFRNNGTQAGEIKFDHCTVFNTQGYHGGMQPGPIHNLTITNSIFYDMIVMGSRATETGILNSQPEKELQWVLSIDNVFEDGKIVVRNNNIYWDKKYIDLWALYDTVKAPGAITPTILNALGADSSNAYISEEISFKTPPTSLYDFAVAALANRTSELLPENFYWGEDTALDFSYGTTAQSYTAADNGLPLGDLNWYPDKKAIWQTTSVEKIEILPTEFSLEQNYPNPFNPATKIVYNIPQASRVKLEVFDILGRLVTTLVDQEQEVGQYRVDFDGSKLSSGVYVYRLTTPGLIQIKKMILIK